MTTLMTVAISIPFLIGIWLSWVLKNPSDKTLLSCQERAKCWRRWKLSCQLHFSTSIVVKIAIAFNRHVSTFKNYTWEIFLSWWRQPIICLTCIYIHTHMCVYMCVCMLVCIYRTCPCANPWFRGALVKRFLEYVRSIWISQWNGCIVAYTIVLYDITMQQR